MQMGGDVPAVPLASCRHGRIWTMGNKVFIFLITQRNRGTSLTLRVKRNRSVDSADRLCYLLVCLAPASPGLLFLGLLRVPCTSPAVLCSRRTTCLLFCLFLSASCTVFLHLCLLLLLLKHVCKMFYLFASILLLGICV